MQYTIANVAGKLYIKESSHIRQIVKRIEQKGGSILGQVDALDRKTVYKTLSHNYREQIERGA